MFPFEPQHFEYSLGIIQQLTRRDKDAIPSFEAVFEEWASGRWTIRGFNDRST